MSTQTTLTEVLLNPITSYPVWLLLSILLIISVFFSIKDLRDSEEGLLLYLIGGIRLLTTILISVLLLRPAIKHSFGRFGKATVAVLLDDSKSMDLKFNKTTRFEEAKQLINSLEVLNKRDLKVDYYIFDSKTYALKTANLSPEGTRTDIVGSIRFVLNKYKKDELAALVLFTDGEHNTGPLGLPETIPPINVILFKDNHPDISISPTELETFGFVHNTKSVRLKLYLSGKKNTTATIFVKDKDYKTVVTKHIELKRGKNYVDVDIKPSIKGVSIYKVEVESPLVESNYSNNSAYFSINATRDRIRVLHIAGSPTWDVRYLRDFLFENPNVDLVSFFILRTVDDVLMASDREISLIPFPVDEIFRKRLLSFDVLIFQDFDYIPYGIARYLNRIKEFVEGGGSFLMIGGKRSFSDGMYFDTPVEDILPVSLLRNNSYTPKRITPVVNSRLSWHPVLRGLDLSALPYIQGYNAVLSVKKDAEVLLSTENNHLPLIVLGKKGNGRSCAILTDGMWEIRFKSILNGNSRDVYGHLFNALLKWLIKDPDMDPDRIDYDVVAEKSHSKINFVVFSNPNKSVEVSLMNLYTKKETIQKIELDRFGIYRGSFQVKDDGYYMLKIKSTTAERLIRIFRFEKEMSRDDAGRKRFIDTIRERDGIILNPSQFDIASIKVSDTRPFIETGSEVKQIWNLWLVILAIILLFSTEWAIRRMSGYR